MNLITCEPGQWTISEIDGRFRLLAGDRNGVLVVAEYGVYYATRDEAIDAGNEWLGADNRLPE